MKLSMNDNDVCKRPEPCHCGRMITQGTLTTRCWVLTLLEINRVEQRRETQALQRAARHRKPGRF